MSPIFNNNCSVCLTDVDTSKMFFRDTVDPERNAVVWPCGHVEHFVCAQSANANGFSQKCDHCMAFIDQDLIDPIPLRERLAIAYTNGPEIVGRLIGYTNYPILLGVFGVGFAVGLYSGFISFQGSLVFLIGASRGDSELCAEAAAVTIASITGCAMLDGVLQATGQALGVLSHASDRFVQYDLANEAGRRAGLALSRNPFACSASEVISVSTALATRCLRSVKHVGNRCLADGSHVLIAGPVLLTGITMLASYYLGL